MRLEASGIRRLGIAILTRCRIFRVASRDNAFEIRRSARYTARKLQIRPGRRQRPLLTVSPTLRTPLSQPGVTSN